ncbi:MAG TPA: M1 family metallopeptidase [Vicinamibacterales bacterium]|nr:M1 family metallopeptidase [Vicinamibacterales bacterium]HPW20337.1 M1 family metallopeptidase [Vicinamibacterales bacterium]
MARRLMLVLLLALAIPGAGLRGTLLPRQAAPPPDAAAPVDRSAPLPAARSPRNANYSIDVRLDPGARALIGHEDITWRNTSAHPTSKLCFHLYYNAWKHAQTTWMREARLRGRSRARSVRAGDWGWTSVTSVRLLRPNAEAVELADRRFASPDDGNEADETVMEVLLPDVVPPGESIRIGLDWNARIPRTFSRTGAVGSYYFLAQWFPKLAVLEDAGWNCHQFHAGTEFYADYGVYQVRMTVPSSWVVGATGLERGRTDNPDGTTTHAYHADDVHDFAWTTSPDYLVRTARFEHPTLPAVEMRLLLQPEHAGQADRHFDATRTALRFYGEWFGAYPYGHLTVVDPAWQSGAGGMEYPTLFTAGTRWLAPRDVMDPEGVTIHEAGHQFWYAMVGNNEFEDAWLDEGLNTFSTGRAIEANPAYRVNYQSSRYFGGFVPWVFRDIPVSREVDENGLSAYRASAESDAPSTPSFRYFPSTGGGLSYSKTALWLHTLERHLGWPALQRAMSAFFERWKFRHPKPQDFFDAVNESSGRDMTWFFDQVHRSSTVFDYGVQSVMSETLPPAGSRATKGSAPVKRSTVVVRRYGEAVFPVEVLVTFEGGETVREAWDGKDRWKAFTYERAMRVVSAVVDPDRVLLLDIDRTNNSFTTEPRSREAARKWMLKWMVWLQDALATSSFFI